MHPSKGQALVLFSPALCLVLLAWRVASEHGFISNNELAAFLVAMAILVSAAEIVRIHLRAEKKRRDRRTNRRDRQNP